MASFRMDWFDDANDSGASPVGLDMAPNAASDDDACRPSFGMFSSDLRRRDLFAGGLGLGSLSSAFDLRSRGHRSLGVVVALPGLPWALPSSRALCLSRSFVSPGALHHALGGSAGCS